MQFARVRLLKRMAAIGAPIALVLFAASVTAQQGQGGDPQGAPVDTQGGETDTHTPAHKVFTGGPITYKKVVTYRLPQSTSSLSFVSLPNSFATVPIAPGRTALINVRFHAETRCNESGGAGEFNWCEVRILIGGVEGHPQASSFPPDTFALDSTDNGTETVGSWEGHALERHRCIRNSGTTTLNVSVVVQWKVTNFGGDADVPLFWVDDWSLVAERSDGCSPVSD